MGRRGDGPRPGRLGIWNWDLTTNELTWSEQCKIFFGYPPDAQVTFDMIGDKDVVKRYGGLGLGLAISKAVIDAPGGEIAVQKRRQGSWSRIQRPSGSHQ